MLERYFACCSRFQSYLECGYFGALTCNFCRDSTSVDGFGRFFSYMADGYQERLQYGWRAIDLRLMEIYPFVESGRFAPRFNSFADAWLAEPFQSPALFYCLLFCLKDGNLLAVKRFVMESINWLCIPLVWPEKLTVGCIMEWRVSLAGVCWLSGLILISFSIFIPSSFPIFIRWTGFPLL